jgi:hypothetical protein
LTRPRTGWQYGRRASEVGLIVSPAKLATPPAVKCLPRVVAEAENKEGSMTRRFPHL